MIPSQLEYYVNQRSELIAKKLNGIITSIEKIAAEIKEFMCKIKIPYKEKDND